jgi:predicted Zn-dependent protease
MRRVAWLAVISAALVLLGCQGNGHLLSREDEIRLGRQAGQDFERQYGLDTDPQVRELVQSIGARIAQQAMPPEYPYEYRVLRRREVNANAFPGGLIYVWRGLVDQLHRDPDQLAWVMGHETAHVARRHVTRRLERSLGYELLIGFLFKKQQAAQAASLIADLVLRDYGREQEYEADRWGIKYAQAAGYDPTAAVAVLRTFQALQKDKPSKFELLFATHPGNDERIKAAQSYLAKQGWSGRYYP